MSVEIPSAATPPPLKRASNLLRDVAGKGFFHLLSANFVINLLAFGSQILVVKFLTPAEMGDIKTMQSFVGIAVIIAGFGFNTAVLKICSENRPTEERAAVLKGSFRFVLLPIVLILGVIAVIASLGWFSPESRVNAWITVFMLSIPATVVTSLIMMYLQALKRIKLMARLQTVIRLAGVVAIVACAYLYGFAGFVIATVAVAFAALIPLLFLVRDDLRIAERSSDLIKRTWYFARWSFAANLVGTINGYVDILLLNYLIADRVAFGYYSIATIFILGLNQITVTIQSIATPYFSEKAGEESEFRRVLRKYQKLMVLLASAAALAAFVIVPEFIRYFYGESYADAGFYFRLLTLKYLVWSSYALVGVALLGMGKIRYSFYSAGAGLLVSSVLSYLLIIHYGLTGAAVAQVFAAVVIAALVFTLMKRALREEFDGRHASQPGIEE